MTAAQNCGNCGAKLRAEASFCVSCGASGRSVNEMKKLISGKGATLALIVSSLAIIALVACIGSAGPQVPSGQSGPQGTAAIDGSDGSTGSDGTTGNISRSGSANPLVSDADSFPVDTTKFDLSSLVAINEEDCTLSNGDSSNCYQITVTGFPSDRDELGPFCTASFVTGIYV